MAGGEANAQPCVPHAGGSRRPTLAAKRARPLHPDVGSAPRSPEDKVMTAFTVGYFVGSLARGSLNRKLATALVRLAPQELTMREIPIRDLPLYSYDYDSDYPPPG